MITFKSVFDRAFMALMFSLVIAFTCVALSQIQAVYAQPVLQPVVVIINSSASYIDLAAAPEPEASPYDLGPVKVVVD